MLYKTIGKRDFKLLFHLLSCVIMGTLAIYSISFREEGFNNFKKHVVALFIGGLVLFFIRKINYSIWQKNVFLIYCFSIIFLISVFFWGIEKNGTFGWIKITEHFNFQPVEFSKIAIILFLASYFSKLENNDKRFRHFVITGFFLLIPLILILRQPDLGSASVLVFIWIIMLFFWEARKRHLAVITFLLLLLSLVSWFFFLKTYQKERLSIFLNPESDARGSGYHLIQSITALGSGGFYGKGLGKGSQTQKFLPEAHTDFIFAVIGEELGLLGIMFLLFNFYFIFFHIYKIAKKSMDNFGRFLTGGVLALFFFQFFVNIGMNIGIFPIIGVPLPFVSYGGSALISEIFLLGIVFNVYSVYKRSESYLGRF